MFSPVHHDLEGLAAERFRSLAGQLRRLQQQHAAAERLDAMCRDELAWIESARGLNGCREKYAACIRLLTDLAKLRWRIVQDGFGIELATPSTRRIEASEVMLYKGCCQVTGHDSPVLYGVPTAEAHHVVYRSRGGLDEFENLVLVCPNLHAALHAAEANFDYSKLAFIFPNGRVEPLVINEHLTARAA